MEMPSDLIETQKNKVLAVEFVYDKIHETEVNIGKIIKIQYKSIFFPAEGIYSNIAFFVKIDNSTTPVGLNENLDRLVDAMTK